MRIIMSKSAPWGQAALEPPRWGRARLCLWAAILALVGACSSSSSPTGTAAKADAASDGATLADVADTKEDAAVDVGGSDTATAVDGTNADAADAADTLDVVATCPGAAGCACNADAECGSQLCLETPKGKVCATVCSGTCADGDFKCAQVPVGAAQVSVCVPKFGNHCNPCLSNAQCASPGHSDATCVDHGDSGFFCGSACSADSDCPAGDTCATTKDVAGATSKQCIPKNGGECACSEAAMAQKLSTTCEVAAGDSACKGERFCLAKGTPGAPTEGGLTACNAAKGTEVCDGKDNDCNGQTDEGTCDDKNVCTTDGCGGTAGCSNTAKTGPCDADGSKCTDGDTCTGGKCVAGPALVCDDGKACTDDACDPVSGCTVVNNAKPCDFDNTECTVDDHCQDGSCQPGLPKACEGGSPCVTGACNKGTGKCVYKAKEDGAPCDDGNACTSSDGCSAIDSATSECQGGKVACDDKNACTSDSCNPTSGCLHTPADSAACDDGDKCTQGDSCTAGACVGLGIDVTQVCNDKNPCTVDTCDPSVGCASSATTTDGQGCDDGNSCTAGDLCASGVCLSGKNSCKCASDADCAKQEDGNTCNGTLVCDKSAVGQAVCIVSPDTVVKCDTSLNSGCQSNDCNPVSGKCEVVQQTNGLPCDADGSLCTAQDACLGGKCLAGAGLQCDDKNACTSDSCDPKNGCQYVANTAPCDADGNACTQNDACDAGACVAGKKKVCDDQEPCTKDSCDSQTAACSFAPLVQSCSDDNACTSGDACGKDPSTGKQTCVPGAPVSCDDDVPCTLDGCDSTKGCTHAVDTSIKAACYGGDPKTAGKGPCKNGVKQCQADGSFGACAGDVLPAGKELCNSIDDTCDGTTDEGCQAGAFVAEFAVARLTATATKYKTDMVAGSAVIGEAQGQSKTATYGFYVWLKAFVGM